MQGIMAGRLHVAHPVHTGRAVCGRRLPASQLTDAETYRRTPPARRCRKCAQRISLTWRLPAFGRAAKQSPGYQHQFDW